MADDNTDDKFLTDESEERFTLDEVKEKQKLPEDHDPPFSSPDGVQDRIDDTHQVTDTGMDEHERYDAGIEAASGADPSGQAADESQAPPPPADA